MSYQIKEPMTRAEWGCFWVLIVLIIVVAVLMKAAEYKLFWMMKGD